MIFVKSIELFVFYRPDLGRYNGIFDQFKNVVPLHHMQPKDNLEPNICNLNYYHAGFKHGIYFKTAFTKTKQAKPTLCARPNLPSIEI